MDIFNKIGDTIFSTGKDVSQKAKDLSGIAKLKLDIKMKEDFVEKQYAQVGKKYYETHKDDAVLDYEEVQVIEEALDIIDKMKAQILDIKGSKECSNCGTLSDESAEFCSNCGARLQKESTDNFTTESEEVFEEETDDSVKNKADEEVDNL